MVCSEEMPDVTVRAVGMAGFRWVSGSPSEHGEDGAGGCWEDRQGDGVAWGDSPHRSLAQRVREGCRGGGSAGPLAGGAPCLCIRCCRNQCSRNQAPRSGSQRTQVYYAGRPRGVNTPGSEPRTKGLQGFYRQTVVGNTSC